MNKPIKLGHEVKDIVTGIKGHCMAISQWLTGCDTVVMEPHVQEGKKQDRLVIDINAIEYVSEGVRPKFFPTEYAEEKKAEIKAEKKAEKTGGPHDNLVARGHKTV